jgi:hypothetical protein
MLMAASIVALCGLGAFFFSLVEICAKPVPAPPKTTEEGRGIHRNAPGN